MLKRSGGEISMPLLSAFLIESGLVNFESLVSTYQEIESNGFVRTRQTADRTFLNITQEGEQALSFFKNAISAEIRSQADRYLCENGHVLQEERTYIADYDTASSGGYLVHLAVREDGKLLYEINITVPSEQTALTMISRWKEAGANIYAVIMQSLL